MPRLLERLESLVLVEYSQFTVQDYDGAHSALTLGSDHPPSARIAGGRGGLWIKSYANDHYPKVVLELWDEPDARPNPGWESVGTANFVIDGARLRLSSVTSEYGSGTLSVGQRGAFHAHVYVAGRGEAEKLDVASFAEGVENWLVKIWRDPGVLIPETPELYLRS